MMNRVGGKGPVLYPEVLHRTVFLIRTGAAPPGPPRGTASACDSAAKGAIEQAYS